MSFVLTGQSIGKFKYGTERLEFRIHTNNTEDARAVEMIRWVTDARGKWYVLWKGFDFVGNARYIYRDRIKAGWVAA